MTIFYYHLTFQPNREHRHYVFMGLYCINSSLVSLVRHSLDIRDYLVCYPLRLEKNLNKICSCIFTIDTSGARG